MQDQIRTLLQQVLRDTRNEAQKQRARKKELRTELKRLEKGIRELSEFIKAVEGLEGLESDDFSEFFSAYGKLHSWKETRPPRRLRELMTRLRAHSDRYDSKAGEMKLRFGRCFRQLCEESGLVPVEGDEIAGFRIKGILRVKINWHSRRSSFSTLFGGRAKVVLRSLDPERILQVARTIAAGLFDRPFEAEEFLASLFDSYQSVSGNTGRDVLLKSVAERMRPDMDQFAIDLGRLISKGVTKTSTGLVMTLSSGTDGITVYDEGGRFRTYKFVRF